MKKNPFKILLLNSEGFFGSSMTDPDVYSMRRPPSLL